MTIPTGADFIVPHLHGFSKLMARRGKKVIVDYSKVRESYMSFDGYVSYRHTVIHVPLIIKHGKATFKITLQFIKPVFA
jgi:hypothetical protein